MSARRILITDWPIVFCCAALYVAKMIFRFLEDAVPSQAEWSSANRASHTSEVCPRRAGRVHCTCRGSAQRTGSATRKRIALQALKVHVIGVEAGSEAATEDGSVIEGHDFDDHDVRLWAPGREQIIISRTCT